MEQIEGASQQCLGVMAMCWTLYHCSRMYVYYTSPYPLAGWRGAVTKAALVIRSSIVAPHGMLAPKPRVFFLPGHNCALTARLQHQTRPSSNMWPSCNQQPTLIYCLVPPIEVWLSQPPYPREAGEGAKAGGVVTDFHPLRPLKPRPRETSQSLPSVGVIVNKSNATTGSQMANKRRITVTEAPLPAWLPAP